jgi:hypothetical protein
LLLLCVYKCAEFRHFAAALRISVANSDILPSLSHFRVYLLTGTLYLLVHNWLITLLVGLSLMQTLRWPGQLR